jgi:proline iminopeptidase
MSAFDKNIIPHEKLYIVKFSKVQLSPCLIFIHGGPGLNCGVIEYLIEYEELFKSLDYNIILYDQRACGRSDNKSIDSDKISHSDNVNDLDEIYQYLESKNLKIAGLIGHSYGAKLLYDFLKKTGLTIPSIFVSTADTILIPRLNNLNLDLAYLKKNNSEKYQEILEKMDNLELKKLWQLTEELAPFFQENTDRPYFYWANLDLYKKYQEIQQQINLPINNQVFMSVRKNLYEKEGNFRVDIDHLNIPYLWVNGIQDYIVNGVNSLISNRQKVIPFFKSSHYPHIEENNRFSQLVNKFMKNIRSDYV